MESRSAKKHKPNHSTIATRIFDASAPRETSQGTELPLVSARICDVSPTLITATIPPRRDVPSVGPVSSNIGESSHNNHASIGHARLDTGQSWVFPSNTPGWPPAESDDVSWLTKSISDLDNAFANAGNFSTADDSTGGNLDFWSESAMLSLPTWPKIAKNEPETGFEKRTREMAQLEDEILRIENLDPNTQWLR
ncbi:hypothetical protein QQS21_012275 [Conoideocrella luteorostrata]|uniref:Uncharacterized protein n=1 Tax=Conoideocrella luteorostrata TaxID=1105319 RepID=A0AAJ0CE86_9HYPO|nr:hypothetical protein QQS21_012275 [Conoideocrella luteorostrata]